MTAGEYSDAIPPDFAEVCASIERFPKRGGTFARLRQAARPASAFFLSGHVTAAMRTFVREGVRRRAYAFAVIDIQMLDAIAGTNVPFVYNSHNTEYKLLERRSRFEKGVLQRAFVRVDAARVKPIERRVVRDALETIACSPADVDELVALEPRARARTFVVPNGVDVARYARTFATEPSAPRPTILVTGRFDWGPNRVGLDWFVADVLPAIRARLGTGTFVVRVAGRLSPEQDATLRALADVETAPNPEDMRDELTRAHVVAAAILASSGTRLRILEAWAAGRPVVTTPAGAFGLPHTNGEELFAVEGADAFARAVQTLLADRALWTRMRASGFERAREFDWQRIGERFLRESAELLP